jgi:putative oxidoreductase
MFIALQSYSDAGLFVLRLAVAAVFWVHGTSKKGMWKAQPSPQMPAKMISLMRLLSVAEPLGALAMLSGFLTQLAAVGLGIIMIGAINLKKNVWKVPFNAQDKTGWEFDMLILASCVAILLAGPGAWSLDRLLGLA